MACILVLTSSYPLEPDDASGHFVQAEVRALARQGHHVTVLVPGPRPKTVARCGGDGPGTITVEIVPGGSLFGHPGVLARLASAPWRIIHLGLSSHALLRRARLLSFDRVIAHWILPSGLWSLFLPSAAPLVVIAHGSDVELLLKFPAPLRSWLLGQFKKRGATLRFVSARMKDALLGATLPRDLASYLESAEVRSAHLEMTGTPTRTEARRLLRLSPTDSIAVLVARLVEGKRVSVGLGAADLVPDLRTYVIGSGPLLSELSRDFPRVTFLGQLPRPEALLWISAADLLISASQKEGAPTVIREARLLATPVVSVDVGDLAAWAREDEQLYLVSPKSLT